MFMELTIEENLLLITRNDTENLDNEITQIKESFIDEHFLDNDQADQLEMLIAKAIKLGELYERIKSQTKPAVPEGYVLVEKKRLDRAIHGIEKLFDEDSTLALGELLPIQQDLISIVETEQSQFEDTPQVESINYPHPRLEPVEVIQTNDSPCWCHPVFNAYLTELVGEGENPTRAQMKQIADYLVSMMQRMAQLRGGLNQGIRNKE